MLPDLSALTGAISELSQFELFSNLDRDKLNSLCAGGKVLVHKHREVAFQFGANASQFGIVLSGAYKLSRLHPTGDEAIIHFSGPGDVIAALIMTQESPIYPVTVKAMGPSRMVSIPRSVYLQTWMTTPHLIAKIQMLLSSRMTQMHQQKTLQRAPLSAKIASLLLQLVEQKKEDTNMEIPIPLTRKEIADNLGVTVESVIRIMSDWVKKGYIASHEQHIQILQPGALVEQLRMENPHS